MIVLGRSAWRGLGWALLVANVGMVALYVGGLGFAAAGVALNAFAAGVLVGTLCLNQ